MMPGTHNTTSYVRDYTGNSIIAGRVACQERTLAQQLKDGIRSFDFRLLVVLDQETGEECYWTGHGSRFCPFLECLDTIKEFLDAHPTELVFMHVKNDWTPLNDINCCCCGGCCMRCWICFCGPNCCRRRYVVPERFDASEIPNIIENIIIPKFTTNRIAFANEHVEGDEDKWLLRKDTTLGELVDIGKQVIIYESIDMSIYQKRQLNCHSEHKNIKRGDQDSNLKWRFLFANSYWETVDKSASENIRKLKSWRNRHKNDYQDHIKWMSEQQGLSSALKGESHECIHENYVQITELKAQITWENLTCKYMCWEVCCNLFAGHHTHGQETNGYLQEWLIEDPRVQQFFGAAPALILAPATTVETVSAADIELNGPQQNCEDDYLDLDCNILWMDYYWPSVVKLIVIKNITKHYRA